MPIGAGSLPASAMPQPGACIGASELLGLFYARMESLTGEDRANVIFGVHSRYAGHVRRFGTTSNR